jgi:hypothetical protein
MITTEFDVFSVTFGNDTFTLASGAPESDESVVVESSTVGLSMRSAGVVVRSTLGPRSDPDDEPDDEGPTGGVGATGGCGTLTLAETGRALDSNATPMTTP